MRFRNPRPLGVVRDHQCLPEGLPMLYEFHIIKDTKKSKKTLEIERDDVILRGMETDITTLTSLAVTETEKRLLEIILKKDEEIASLRAEKDQEIATLLTKIDKLTTKKGILSR